MTTAREEAFEEEWGFRNETRPLTEKWFLQGWFDRGWKARDKQPIEITDQMQDIALGIARQKLQEYSPLILEPALGRLVDDIAIAVLEATLWKEK